MKNRKKPKEKLEKKGGEKYNNLDSKIVGLRAQPYEMVAIGI